jgi:AcrR family transcriptional regulator
VPKLWTETIETHKREVQGAILDTTARLVAERGLASVTMSQIAEAAGIGRATLYKYYPDIEAIVVAWHERHVAEHIARLVEARDGASGARERLEAVLETYALITFERARGHEQSRPEGHIHGHATREVDALVHRQEHAGRLHRRLDEVFRDVLAEAAKARVVRRDVAAGELARYCFNALGAARDLSSKAAVRRLVEVTLSGVRPPR